MGYSTEFRGILTFQKDLTIGMLKALQTYLGEDCRDHPEWEKTEDLDYVNISVRNDLAGLEWDGSEKTYGMTAIINMITHNMRQEFPHFQLSGQLEAQGESFDDRWVLVLDDSGIAHRAEVVITGTILECPDCGHKFQLAGLETA